MPRPKGRICEVCGKPISAQSETKRCRTHNKGLKHLNMADFDATKGVACSPETNRWFLNKILKVRDILSVTVSVTEAGETIILSVKKKKALET